VSDNPPSICFDCLNIKGGGGATVAGRLIQHFAASGWVVHVVVASDVLVNDIAQSNNGAIKFHHLPALTSTIKCLIYRHFRFSKLAASVQSDIVFSFNYWTPWKGLQVTYHINATPFFSKQKIRKLVGFTRSIIQPYYSRLAVQRSDSNLFESEYLLSLAKERYGESGIRQPTVRYIGIDTPELVPDRTSNKASIISVTSGAAHKRNDLVLELHRGLNKSGYDVQLSFGGDRAAIEGSLNAFDLEYVRTEKSVKFLGYVPREALYTELCNSTALVSCSEVESFFMVPLEAMSVGCPVICGDFSSVRESIGNAGIVCDAGDLSEMENWFVKLMDEGDRKVWSDKSIKWAGKFDSTECSELIVDAVTCVVKSKTNQNTHYLPASQRDI